MLMNPLGQWYKHRNTFNELATVADITAAYRFFLRRKPDAASFATYKQMIANGLTLSRLISMLINSDEYRQKFGAEQPNFNVISAKTASVDLGGIWFVSTLRNRTWAKLSLPRASMNHM